jgi:4-hydroxy-tetrahydrodipicolinate reductase
MFAPMKKLNIALIGYGKMGQEIEEILLQRGHSVSLRSSSETPFKPEDLKGSDVAIEFSRPEVAVDNIFKCFEAGTPVVCGTTGWYLRLEEVKTEAVEKAGSLLYASNFSIGMNVVFHINRMLARIMDVQPEYNASISEIHHVKKLDKPSGTGITLAEGILDEMKKYDSWKNEETTENGELPLLSERIGEVPGTHIVSYTSDVDKIELRHDAFNRKGFALGAVKGAEWLFEKKGVYSIHDFLKF